ncbi:MAG: hypothetical protein JW787_01565, partial [Sedimentisphaerales bacterium]|nr:hypothetical protein [Sedimentisphaerales bacterium]
AIYFSNTYTTAANSDMDYNLLDGSGNIEWNDTFTNLIDFQAETGCGENCIEANPSFTNPANGDFRIQETSPFYEIPLSPQAVSVFKRFYELYDIEISGYITAGLDIADEYGTVSNESDMENPEGDDEETAPEIETDGNDSVEEDVYSDSDVTSDEYFLQAVTAFIDFEPDVINIWSSDMTVAVYIELPAGFDAGDIDVTSIKLNDEIPALSKPTSIEDSDRNGIPDLMVKFERNQVIDSLGLGECHIKVSGQLCDGTPFSGRDVIRVIRGTDNAYSELRYQTNQNQEYRIINEAAALLIEAYNVVNEMDLEHFTCEQDALKLANEMDFILKMIDHGSLADALDMLINETIQRTNGCADYGQPDRDDWIVTCEGQDLIYPLLLDTVALLENLDR